MDMLDIEFERAVETVTLLGKGIVHNGGLLDGLEYIQECIHSGDSDMVSDKEIRAYHLVCHKMRPLFL
jgi:hypothetical protein